MPGSASREKLLDALRRLLERHRGDGARLTVVEVAREAGVSRATANRDEAFGAAFKRAASEVANLDATKARRGVAGHRRLVADLRRTIDDMANVIQALSVSYERLEDEVTRLRAERSAGAVVPLRQGRRRV